MKNLCQPNALSIKDPIPKTNFKYIGGAGYFMSFLDLYTPVAI